MNEYSQPAIKPKVGDVMATGEIVCNSPAELGRMILVRSGLVIINRSRLRRAQRFGWKISNAPFPFRIPPESVMVERA